MFRYCKSFGLFLLLLALPALAHAQDAFIVRLADDAPAPLRAALGEALGGEVAAKQGDPLFDGVLRVAQIGGGEEAGKQRAAPFAAYTLYVDPAAPREALKAAWAATPGVAYVQDNHRYRLDTAVRADDPLLDSLAHLPVIRAFDAWQFTTGSPTVRVGFVDTGLYFEHPDFAGQVWINPGEDLDGNGRADASDFNGVDDDGNGFVDDLHGYDFVDRPGSVEQGDLRVRDPDPSEDAGMGGGRGHGTLIAGVLAARQDNGVGISGVAPGTRLVPLRAFGGDGLGEDDDIAAAILYAAQMQLDVLNLSFGDVYFSPLMQEAIAYAVARGTVVVASAGNLGGDGTHYPSDYPEVISVAWLTDDGESIASRGQFGVGIDLGAPGSFVFTTLLPRFEADGSFDPAALYGRRSGSSMAAPMVAAAAALLRSLDPTLSPAAVQSILTATARDIQDPGWDHRTAAGLLDVAAALERRLPARVALTTPVHDGGFAGETLAITGSAIDPAFESYSVSYQPGDEDLTDAWTVIEGPTPIQRLDDTLAVWQTGDLAEGVYTLRLAARLRTGRTIEDRRRLFLDRTAPRLTPRVFSPAMVGPWHGLAADLATDDLTDATLRIVLRGDTSLVRSDRRTRRHGLSWADESGRGGTATATLSATNRAGLVTTRTATFEIPARRPNTALFREHTLAVPHGYLLPVATDFDGDRLLEITLNQYQDGWIGDTLATYEWDGAGFQPVQKLVANVIPRDVGDADGDGLLELLTQVAGATLVLEQGPQNPFPAAVSFIDTTGLDNPFDTNAAFGARLTDLDDDGRGEILVHNTRQWRLLEATSDGFAEVLRLENPTAATNTEIDQNEFQQPFVLVEDFDGDGRTDLLVGDGDGDWIIYENTGDDALAAVWTYETPRYNGSARFGQGDFDGDGKPEFVTYTQNWTQPTSEGTREPDIGLYYFWDSPADDTYTLRDSLAIPGLLSRHGSMTAADFDGDGVDELALIDTPHLYIFRFENGRPRLWFEAGPSGGAAPSGLRSVAQVTADFDGDGRPELIAAGADERLHRFVYDAAAAGLAPPVWIAARARDEASVTLTWQSGADSVRVYRGALSGPLDLLATVTADSLVDSRREPARYALQAWHGGRLSPLSEARAVHPRAPAHVVAVDYPAPQTVSLLFSEALRASLRPAQFVLDGEHPTSVLLARDDKEVLVRFDTVPSGVDTLRWAGLLDTTGRPVGQTAAAVAFPEAGAGGLIVAQWKVDGPYALTLIFNAPLDGDFARDVANFRLTPSGEIVEARWQPERPAEVGLTLEGRPVGATGLATSLTVVRMRGAGGERLAAEGTTIALSQAASDLAGVYVFPNPYRADRHGARVMVAGLPSDATIAIFSVQGELVRRLETIDGTGGLAWDLRDAGGATVPSGLYLVRVEAPGAEAVLVKAVVIR